jgi:hypothetical protein
MVDGHSNEMLRVVKTWIRDARDRMMWFASSRAPGRVEEEEGSERDL